MRYSIQGPVTKPEASAEIQLAQIMTVVCHSLNTAVFKLRLDLP